MPRASASRRSLPLLAFAVSLLATLLGTSTALAGMLVARHSGAHSVWSHPQASGGGDRLLYEAFNRAGPVAHAAGINSVLPNFKTAIGYDLRGGRVELTALFIYPFHQNIEGAEFGCTGCVGPGNFGPAKWSGTKVSKETRARYTLTDKLRGGTARMSSKTRIVVDVYGTNRIGRFRVYHLAGGSFPAPVLLATGCTPAYLPLKDHRAALSDWKHLPKVPCNARTPHGSLSISGPVEFSSAGGQPATVSGHIAGSAWLTIFQTNGSCAPNALAENSSSSAFFVPLQVHGTFHVTFKTSGTTTPGNVCAYLQAGGRDSFDFVTPLPDGRIAARAGLFYYAGDSAHITTAATATAGQTTTVTVAGTAKVTGEYLYLFSPNSPCAATAQAEFGVDPADQSTAETQFNYSSPFSVTVPATAPPTVYRCAYLQSSGPSGGAPTGSLLATASAAVTVTQPISPDSVGITSQATAFLGEQNVQQSVTGNAGHSGAYLYEFNAYQACAATAQAEYAIDTSVFSQAESPGAFSTPLVFTVPTNAQPQIFECAYLQSGAPATGGAPTGSTLATGSAQITVVPNGVQITSAPSSVTPGQMNVPVDFNDWAASSGEFLYTFVPTQPCAATAAAENAIDPGGDFAMAVPQGADMPSEVLNVSSGAVPGTTIYECAYLQSAGTAGSGVPVIGTTLATASAPISVS